MDLLRDPLADAGDDEREEVFRRLNAGGSPGIPTKDPAMILADIRREEAATKAGNSEVLNRILDE
jgi:hypothetical protein